MLCSIKILERLLKTLCDATVIMNLKSDGGLRVLLANKHNEDNRKASHWTESTETHSRSRTIKWSAMAEWSLGRLELKSNVYRLQVLNGKLSWNCQNFRRVLKVRGFQDVIQRNDELALAANC